MSTPLYTLEIIMSTEATRLQELKYMIRHFTFIYLVIKWVNLYMSIRTFFRKLWWKSWGYDPEQEIGFYLNEIDYSWRRWKLLILKGYLMQFLRHFVVDPSRTISASLLTRKDEFKLIPYSDYKDIENFESLRIPGRAALKWIMEKEGITVEQLDWKVAQDTELAALVDKIKMFEIADTTKRH